MTSKKNNNGMKVMIMAASLAITLGGWGAFAASQAQNVAAAAPITVSNNSTTNTQSSTQLRQVNPSTLQPQIITRTRSSR